jgi:hypothetical protein
MLLIYQKDPDANCTGSFFVCVSWLSAVVAVAVSAAVVEGTIASSTAITTATWASATALAALVVLECFFGSPAFENRLA